MRWVTWPSSDWTVISGEWNRDHRPLERLRQAKWKPVLRPERTSGSSDEPWPCGQGSSHPNCDEREPKQREGGRHFTSEEGAARRGDSGWEEVAWRLGYLT